jgi:hypothetical protein
VKYGLTGEGAEKLEVALGFTVGPSEKLRWGEPLSTSCATIARDAKGCFVIFDYAQIPQHDRRATMRCET